MRFIGKPNGKLLRGAPGNYNHGQIYKMSYNNCKFAFWELVEPIPELKVPDAGEGDSIYDESIYTPEEISEHVEPVTHPDEVNLDPDTDASIEPYMNYNTSSGKMTPYNVTASDDPAPVIEEPEYTRDELKKKLDEAGVVYKPRTSTKKLRSLVDELVD